MRWVEGGSHRCLLCLWKSYSCHWQIGKKRVHDRVTFVHSWLHPHQEDQTIEEKTVNNKWIRERENNVYVYVVWPLWKRREPTQLKTQIIWFLLCKFPLLLNNIHLLQNKNKEISKIWNLRWSIICCFSSFVQCQNFSITFLPFLLTNSDNYRHHDFKI